MRSPRRMSPERRRQHLIEAALSLFATKAPEQVSIDDIAACADVSRASVYRYFPSTEAIQTAALKTATAELISRLTLDRDGMLLDQLREALVDFVEFATNYAPAYVSLLRSGSVISTTGTETMIDSVRRHALAQILNRADVVEPPHLVTLTIRCWISVVEGSTLTWLQDKFCARDELVEWLVNQLVGMLTATAARDLSAGAMLESLDLSA